MLGGVIVVAMLLVCDIVVFPVCLTAKSCLSYRAFTGGKGEMNYCIIYPSDDDVKISFDKSSQNMKRSDSTAYLLRPPFQVYHDVREFSGSFVKKDLANYHYLFVNDSIYGKVYCETSCTVQVIQHSNTCATYWNNTVLDLSKQNLVGPLEKKKSSTKSKNRCRYADTAIFSQELDGPGTVTIIAEASKEAPHYVYVWNGIFSTPSGRYSYNVRQTIFNTSRAVAKCNEYKCNFNELTGKGRTETYLAVNLFDKNMEGSYMIDLDYHPSKKTNEWISIGFAIATGVFVLIALAGAGCYFVFYNSSSSSSSSSYSSSVDDDEKKVEQTPTDGGDSAVTSTAEATPGGETVSPDAKDVDPAPDYYTGDGEIPMQSI